MAEKLVDVIVKLRQHGKKDQLPKLLFDKKWFNYVVTFFFFLKMAKNWVGRTTLNGEKNRMASTKKKRKKDKHSGETKFQ